MVRSVQYTKSQTHLIVDLEKSFVFAELTPEQLHSIARSCLSEEIELENARRPLNLDDKIVVVSSGLFEIVFYPDKKALADPSSAIVLNELHPGDLYGVHTLYSQSSVTDNEIKLRCTGKGSIVTISTSRFENYMRKWPVIQNALLRDVISRAFDDSIRLGNSLSKLSNTDVVLDRIESVAALMMDSMTGTCEQEEVAQRKFLLKELPILAALETQCTEIEQAYLSSSAGDKEDRIRRKSIDNTVTYTRTTKFGKGQNRKVFSRNISRSEYNDLLEKKEGQTIIKNRIAIKEVSSSVNIIFDIFQDKLSGLVLGEINYKNSDQVRDYELPEYIKNVLVEDVTDDPRYSNRALAMHGLPVH